MKLLITGGAGFIGSALVRHVLKNTTYHAVNVDKLTYSGNLESVEEVSGDARYCFERVDVCDAQAVATVLKKHQPDYIFHLAAESHVDRSIDGPQAFIQTNVVGTAVMLEASTDYWKKLPEEKKKKFRFQHISTDEVYGSLQLKDPKFHESKAYEPNSPYAASKASSDHLVRAWHRTYGFPVVTTNCSNNYGAYQYPEKLIPLAIQKCLENKQIPIYGNGKNIRDWLYVEDHVKALLTIMEKGQTGETYNVGGNAECTNIDLIRKLCALLDELRPRLDGTKYDSLITFVADRPAHDERYAIDFSKLQAETGWAPSESLISGLKKTIVWYLDNQKWCSAVMGKKYQGERLGLNR